MIFSIIYFINKVNFQMESNHHALHSQTPNPTNFSNAKSQCYLSVSSSASKESHAKKGEQFTPQGVHSHLSITRNLEINIQRDIVKTTMPNSTKQLAQVYRSIRIGCRSNPILLRGQNAPHKTNLKSYKQRRCLMEPIATSIYPIASPISLLVENP